MLFTAVYAADDQGGDQLEVAARVAQLGNDLHLIGTQQVPSMRVADKCSCSFRILGRHGSIKIEGFAAPILVNKVVLEIMVNEKDKIAASKFMSLILRHQPQKIGLALDQNGWAETSALIAGMNRAGHDITLADLNEIVATSDKQRFKLSDDHKMIRANQGHSINVDVGLQEAVPPDLLFHGTATRFLSAIKNEGLRPKSRLYVHLSSDIETAAKVGSRHGEAVVLVVDAAKMHKDGHSFYLSDNKVWLTKTVPPEYLKESE